ncbi:MAG: hypothetical protein OXC54_06745 [Rhodospirillaceae bacterium]|nr:hypothetical protein [Rhodospirillaceae bacterium]MCY4237842.1 hypothetical protein [Rhodospirillaceae bacterium]MCY4310991.1 hypothetical protein [Rhodospirillaceae bacterium]
MKEEAGRDALIEERMDPPINRAAPPQVGGRFEDDDITASADTQNILMKIVVRTLAEAAARSQARFGCMVGQP